MSIDFSLPLELTDGTPVEVWASGPADFGTNRRIKRQDGAPFYTPGPTNLLCDERGTLFLPIDGLDAGDLFKGMRVRNVERHAAYRGTYKNAVDWFLDHGDACDDMDFLECWREGNLDAWPEYYVWLNGQPEERLTPEEIAAFFNKLARQVHADNVKAGWWTDLATGENTLHTRNVPEMLCLVHSEISEAMEAHRKGLMDDKLPHRPGLLVELGDAVIRELDMAGSRQAIDPAHQFGDIIVEKMAFNASRSDHKIENRLKDGGKAF